MAAYTGRVMIDTVRGVLRVRKWPRKRPGPRTAIERFWTDWFVQANLLAKYADPMSQVRAIEISQKSGMYPRDVLLMAMRGRLYTWADHTGWKWFSVAAVQDISDTLDVLGQTVGDILVRAADRWRPPAPGNTGDVLTLAGTPALAKWAAPAAAPALVAGAMVSFTVSPSIPNATFTAVDYDNEVFDTASYHDNLVNPSRMTIPAGVGSVRLSAFVGWTSHGTGERICEFRKNGVPFIGGGRVRDPNSDGLVGQCAVSGIIPVVEGDYFEFFVFQSRGGALGFEGLGALNSFTLQAFA